MARLLIAAGAALLMLGIVLVVFPKALSWFGHLPGDVNIRRENVRIFVPITSMLIVSAGGTLLVNLIAWLIRSLR